VTHVPDGEPGAEAFLPEERLPLSDALDAATIGTAYVNHLDHVAGTVEEGKLADLVVLDRNPFDVDPVEIGDVRVLLTLVDGEPVHRDGDWEQS
jgi:predicted amidohydrolase YtcJ